MRKNALLGFLLLVLCADVSVCWDSKFDFSSCYDKRMEERMPLSIDNLISIIESYERENSNTSPEDIADAILGRYRDCGVIYNPEENLKWSIHQKEEVDKQELDDKLLKLSVDVPEDSFLPREECSLHMSVSHSIDNYPHAGVDDVWEGDYSRKKRSSMDRSLYLPEEVEPAEHPIEFGVIQTRAGPVAGGLLLAGIVTLGSSKSYSVGELVGSDNAQDYMPSEMISKKVEAMYGVTISGEIAQAAVLNGKSSKRLSFEVGPTGLFSNCTACARLYSLEDTDFSYLSRAEIFGALDGFIIAKFLSSYSYSPSLSEILRMYYSNHGLYNPDIRACNRKNIYNTFQGSFKDTIEEQALNYMYAYQDYFDDLKSYVGQHQENFAEIESEFSTYLNDVMSAFDSFISGYSYDDVGYEECQDVSPDNVLAETQVDLVVVYSPTGSIEEIEKQAQYIGLTARYIGVGYHRSRIAVYNGRAEKWILPMSNKNFDTAEDWMTLMRNYSNIADFTCNYTTFTDYSGSSTQDFLEVMDELTKYYFGYYSYIRNDLERTGKHSLVVLWNLPSSFDGNEDDILRAWNEFNYTYPDVNFVFAGSKDSQLDLIYNSEFDNQDELMYIDTSTDDPQDIALKLVEVIQKSHRMFVYTACDTLNSDYESFDEGGHVYTGYVSPNFTTYIRIPPQNFHFSETVKLSFSDGDVRVCLSRVNQHPSDDDNTDDTFCENPPFDYEQSELCGRYLEQCEPIYISVRGNSDASSDCTDDECQFPNQIDFEFNHEGMICGVWGLLPTPALLVAFLLILRSVS